MVSIVGAAPIQANTDADVALLVARIEDDVYIAPSGIFNTMTRARDHGKWSLRTPFGAFSSRTKNALDLFNHAFFTCSLWVQMVSVLLSFATQSRNDKADRLLAEKIAGWTTPWDNALKSGSAPAMNGIFAARARSAPSVPH